jgi:hypothetical protein
LFIETIHFSSTDVDDIAYAISEEGQPNYKKLIIIWGCEPYLT